MTHPKHIHFIGICGVGMSALAILWHKKGWKVTGSDVGFYPPISTHLQNNHINFYPGWHPEKIGFPEMVVVGNVAGSENPEWKYVQENNIPYLSYPELIANNLVKEHSIVCAGTYGKTSSTVLLSWILKNADFKPAYMFGGLSLDLPESADDPVDSLWSVLEGDEYKTSRWDNQAKFFSYRPTHLLLTAVEWDHADLYPTEASYFGAFKKLVGLIPENGLIVASQNVKLKFPNPTILKTYGKNKGADYQYSDLKQTKDGIIFNINYLNNIYQIHCPVMGEYMAENICGAFAMANEIGVPVDSIINGIANFHGIKRRLEKRGEINGAAIFDDIAHSPVKAKSILETLRQIYSGKIYAIFEPNGGNRRPESEPQYDHAFKKADEVIIPTLTKIKIDQNEEEKPFDGKKLSQVIAKTHKKVKFIGEDKKVIKYLTEKIQPGDAVVFMGSHGFRGMIEELVSPYLPSSTTSA